MSQRSPLMPINSDGILRLPRPESVAYDDAMEDVAVCPHGLTFEDELDVLRKVYKETTDD